ncbi:hypothetical protein BH11PAT4_BH11PAT4_2010 [soil metagenome]
MTLAFEIITVVLLLGGFLGVLIPVFPGVPFMFVVALGYGMLTSFTEVTGSFLLFFAALAVVSVVIDYTSGVIGSKFSGATKRAALWGFIGSILGTLVLPLIGTFVGLFMGIIAAELSQLRTIQAALKAGVGGVIGAAAGIVLNFIIASVFFITFLIAVF